MSGLSYREHRPAAALRPFISCLWELSGPAEAVEPEPDRILPDGQVELILHGGDPFEHHPPSGEVSRQGRAFVVGQLTGPFFLRPGGRVDVLGVRFRPGGLAPFVALPLSELTGASVDVEDLWGGSGRHLVESLLGGGGPGGRLGRVETWLLDRLGGVEPQFRRVHPLIQSLVSRVGIESVAALASRVGLSVRQIQRIHRDQVGLPPTLTARILRFQRVVRTLGARTGESLASVAVTQGYVDQPHMTREFREFSGITPAAYRKLRHPLSDLFTGQGP